jgi:hypothetical protein
MCGPHSPTVIRLVALLWCLLFSLTPNWILISPVQTPPSRLVLFQLLLPTSTCLVASPSIYHLSAKPPRQLSCSQPRKRFHPYTNLAHSKKHKLNVSSPSSISEVDEVYSSPQNVTLAAGVAGFNLPPPPQ